MSVPYLLAADTEPSELGGLTGWVLVIESRGEVGVGMLVALENRARRSPSEIVRPWPAPGRRGPVNVVM